MTDFLVDVVIVILSVALIVGSIMFTVYLILNEKKLKETKSTQKLKKMYRNALYLSLLIVIIGIMAYVVGINIKIIEVVYFGWVIFSAGVITTVYSSIGLYNAVYKKNKKSESI